MLHREKKTGCTYVYVGIRTLATGLIGNDFVDCAVKSRRLYVVAML